MNWTASYFCLATVLVLIGTEITRSIIDRRRVKRDGLGGTQDVLLWGTLIAFLCGVGALVSWLVF